jgi:DNA-binding CsgD family transcriptional regulator
MTLWQQLCEAVDQLDSAENTFSSYQQVLREVQELAQDQARKEEQVILDLLNQALCDRRRQSNTQHAWETLSQREKEVTALVCTGLTGRQIAAYLVLSPETIKTHVRHILRKFGLNSRQELRNQLTDWDFNHWIPDRPWHLVDSETRFQDILMKG